MKSKRRRFKEDKQTARDIILSVTDVFLLPYQRKYILDEFCEIWKADGTEFAFSELCHTIGQYRNDLSN